MIRDLDLNFSEAQTFTVDAASTNIVDQQALGDAAGKELYLVVQTGATDWTSLVSLVISIQTDSDVAFGTAETVLVSPTILLAALKANTRIWCVRLPKGLKRYIRLYYDTSTTAATATITAFLTPNVPTLLG